MSKHPYGVFDVETTIVTSRGRKGNPFDPRNWLVLPGWKFPGERWGRGEFAATLEESRSHDWFRRLLAETNLLVGFNIKFDIHHAIMQSQENYDAWVDWIANGGQIWDCQLAEYLLDGMIPSSQYLSLDEVAPRYGGNVKVDEVKELWEAGINTDDIDPDLLYRYLVGNEATGEEGDLGNTELIFKGQLARARKYSQMKSILLNMGSLVYTIEAEYRGMYTDLPLGEQIAKELEEEIVQLKDKLMQYLPPDLPFEFNWGSRVQLSALIFGGDVKYKARVPIFDEDGNPTYKQVTKEHYELEDGRLMEVGEYDALAGDEPEHAPSLSRFKSGKRAGEPKTKKVKVNDLTQPKTRIEEFVYRFEGFTEPDKEWEGKTPGVYSTSSEVMEALGHRDIPFLKDLSRHAGAVKDLGTYFITDDGNGGKKGMLTLVDPDTLVIHHSLNHTATVTGRFSSTKPNLQNLSSGEKSQVKKVFVSRWRKEGKIIQSDFTALEIYIQAILTGSVQMLKDLADGLDMHCVRVAQSEGVEYNDELLLKCKGDDEKGIEPDPVWKSKRKKAKVFSFQRAYGAGIAKIAKSTGMSEEEAQAFADADAERYPEVEPYYEELSEQIARNSRETGQVVRHPDYPAKEIHLRRGYYRTPDNKLYAYLEQPAPKFLVERRGVWSSFSPTEIKNYVVQGSGAEWAKAAMWIAVRAFYRKRNFDGKAVLVNQVHDACYADAHNSVAVEAAALLHASMEAASAFMEWYFGWEQPVHVPSDTTWGESMAEEKAVPGLRDHLSEAREFVRQTYMGE